MFPQAEVIATPGVKAKIEQKLQGKLDFWAPKMGANAPVKPVLPTAYQGKHWKLMAKLSKFVVPKVN